MDMRSLLTVWLIALFSLSSLSATDQAPAPCLAPAETAECSAPVFHGTARPGSPETPVTFDDYWKLVRDTRQAIDRMQTKPETAIRQELDTLALRWQQVTAVQYSDGSVTKVDSAYLVAQLQHEPPELKRLGHELDALLQAHEKYPSKVFSAEDIVPLQAILARPEFQWREKQQSVRTPNWLDKILEWIENFRDSVLNTTFRVGRIPVIIAAIILFLLSLFFISRGLSRNLVRQADLGGEDDENDQLLTSKGAFKRAENLSLQGDYRNAIRYLYLSSLLVLDEQGLMRYDRSRTNREYLRSVSSKPELAKPLQEVIDVFDRVWYGFEGVDEQTYQTYVERVDELREKKE